MGSTDTHSNVNTRSNLVTIFPSPQKRKWNTRSEKRKKKKVKSVKNNKKNIKSIEKKTIPWKTKINKNWTRKLYSISGRDTNRKWNPSNEARVLRSKKKSFLCLLWYLQPLQHSFFQVEYKRLNFNLGGMNPSEQMKHIETSLN